MLFKCPFLSISDRTRLANRAHLDITTNPPLLRGMEERVGERRSSAGTIGKHRSKAPLPSPLPALRCGERELATVVVARCARALRSGSQERGWGRRPSRSMSAGPVDLDSFLHRGDPGDDTEAKVQKPEGQKMSCAASH